MYDNTRPNITAGDCVYRCVLLHNIVLARQTDNDWRFNSVHILAHTTGHFSLVEKRGKQLLKMATTGFPINMRLNLFN